jgi:hypothetical protein
MPLTVKAFRGKALSGFNSLMPGEMMSDDDSIGQDDTLHIHQGNVGFTPFFLRILPF